MAPNIVFPFTLLSLTATMTRTGVCCNPTLLNRTTRRIEDASFDDSLRYLLGDQIEIRSTENLFTANAVESAKQLNCNFDTPCTWTNYSQPISWILIKGTPNANVWPMVTGSTEYPEGSFLMAASAPRPFRVDNAQFRSGRIGCQRGDGRLTMRVWRSHSFSHSAIQLSVCIRVAYSLFEKCRRVKFVPNSSLAEATIEGPIQTEFQIILVASNFISASEGAFIALDDIRYEADVYAATECHKIDFDRPRRNHEQSTFPDVSIYYDNTDDTDNAYDETEIFEYRQLEELFRNANELSAEQETGSSSNAQGQDATVTPPNDDGLADFLVCQSLSCDFDKTKTFCSYDPFGRGASGVGKSVGWRLTNGYINRANPLTGIRFDVDHSDAGLFAIAEVPGVGDMALSTDPNFADPMRYVLESETVVVRSDTLVLVFFEYLATDGIRVRVCRDARLRRCLYESAPLTKFEPKIRSWKRRTMNLPPGRYKLFAAVEHDHQQLYNAGQVGVASFRLHHIDDLLWEHPIC